MDMVVNILVSFVLCVCFIWGSAWRSWCEKERKSLGFNFFFFPPARGCVSNSWFSLVFRESWVHSIFFPTPHPANEQSAATSLFPCLLATKTCWAVGKKIWIQKKQLFSRRSISQRLSSPKFFTFHILFEVYADSIRAGKHTRATQY